MQTLPETPSPIESTTQSSAQSPAQPPAMPSFKVSGAQLRQVGLSLLAMVVGYVTLTASTLLLYYVWMQHHSISAQFLAFAALMGVVFSALGGYVTTLIARRAPVVHATILSVLLTLLYMLSSLLSLSPVLVFVLNTAIAVTGVMIGGWFRYWQINRRTDDEAPAVAS
jgi:hypothetical protein